MALKRDRQNANKNAHNTGEGGKKSSGGGGTTVECLNYSPELNLIAFGGVQGRVGVLDATTVTFKGLYDAHNPPSAGRKGEGQGHEVQALYFHDKEKILISVARDSEIIMWDAQKM